MKCPKCDQPFAVIKGQTQHVEGQDVIVLSCPACDMVLAVVNKEPIRTERAI